MGPENLRPNSQAVPLPLEAVVSNLRHRAEQWGDLQRDHGDALMSRDETTT